MEEFLQPQKADLVLGGNPVTSAVLGGIAGLHHRLTNSPVDIKVELLTQSQNYGETGIGLLQEYATDSALIVRAKACQLLQAVDSLEAREAIAQGLLLNPGDLVFEVYESVVSYYSPKSPDDIDDDTCCYELLRSREQINREGGAPDLVSRHIWESSARKAAWLHHQWRSLQVEPNYLPAEFHEGRTFDVVDWCIRHQILIRLPRESKDEFEERVKSCSYSSHRRNQLPEIESISQFSGDNYPIEPFDTSGSSPHPYYDFWRRKQFEARAIAYLNSTQQYELLAKLWSDAVGQLAFVHPRTIAEPTYIEVTENL